VDVAMGDERLSLRIANELGVAALMPQTSGNTRMSEPLPLLCSPAGPACSGDVPPRSRSIAARVWMPMSNTWASTAMKPSSRQRTMHCPRCARSRRPRSSRE
jgi:hypothetical protein